ncbi:Threonylcarbamoyl-AMP synthase / SUA5 domain with internal deletion [hydrothermal vent metagenome]|uniref:Threonylcarbamoyl-AMP synthase n=1 Tax=hydrothermal vent metagenome TaxID=652676 RepID=A0A3B1D458_9ZZZZ
MILEANTENINKAAEAIKSGEIIAFPTETVYGLGADGLNPTAVAKIFEAKNRPSFNPLILHIASAENLYELVDIKSRDVEKLIAAFWPGPLTLVLPKKEIVPDIVTAGNPTVAVRMPKHPVALDLIKASQTPIAAPSANTFGFLSPTTAAHVEKQLGDKVNIILDGGKSDIGVESTIIEITEKEIYLLRPGGIAIEQIEKICNTEIVFKQTDSNNPNAPGQLLQHYAPKVPIKFLSEINETDIKNKKLACLFFKANNTNLKFKRIEILSPSGNFHEAAANLFHHLHLLEVLDIDLILVEPVEEKGLGIAIMDRLRKATNRYR